MDSSIEYIELLSRGAKAWNEWRINYPFKAPCLREVNFVNAFSGNGFYDLPEFYGVNFSDVDFNCSSFRNSTFCDCTFDGAKITFSDLVDAYFQSCTFKNVNMRVCKIGNAHFIDCIFEDSDLSYCSAENTSFHGSSFKNTALENISFVKSDFSNTVLDGCRVYGISSWNLNLDNSEQRNLVITKKNEPEITVDNIELAQFLYLMINNENLRNIINTITSKVVLILGNFSPERKEVLDNIRVQLRSYDLIPVMFDFNKPNFRNLTETVITLASMSKFIIADITSPRSIPHELATLVKEFPSIAVYPIIQGIETEYGMFQDLTNYPWVKEIRRYSTETIDEMVRDISESL